LIGKAAGAKVIVTSSSDEKLERSKELGADYLINYRSTPEWDQEVMRVTHGKGADVIFENGGALTTRLSFRCVAWGGLINSIGYVSGKVNKPEDKTNMNVSALMRNFTLKGILNGPRDRFEKMLTFCEKHGIRPVVDKVWKFEEAREALDMMWEGSYFGKIVVKVGH
jgi:NADPH:quinone reductase-like Zn-dependent oxidoreductase